MPLTNQHCLFVAWGIEFTITSLCSARRTGPPAFCVASSSAVGHRLGGVVQYDSAVFFIRGSSSSAFIVRLEPQWQCAAEKPQSCCNWYHHAPHSIVNWRGWKWRLLSRCGDVHPNPGPDARCWQINANGLTTDKVQELGRRLDQHRKDPRQLPAAIGVIETHFTEKSLTDKPSLYQLEGYASPLCVFRTSKSGGLALYVRNDFTCAVRTKVVQDQYEQLSVELSSNEDTLDERLPVTLLYVRNGRKFPVDEVLNLASSAALYPSHLIMADSNSHHERWDPRCRPESSSTADPPRPRKPKRKKDKTDDYPLYDKRDLQAGTEVVAWCDVNDYEVANDPTVFTRRIPSNPPSSPDITLYSHCVVTDWCSNFIPTMATDHALISFTTRWGTEAETPSTSELYPPKKQRNWKKADVNGFQAHVKAGIATFKKESRKNRFKGLTAGGYLAKLIVEATKKFVPGGSCTSQARPGAQMTEEVAAAYETVESLFAEFKEAQDTLSLRPEEAERYEQQVVARERYRELCDNARTRAIHKTIKKLDPCEPESWKTLKKMSSSGATGSSNRAVKDPKDKTGKTTLVGKALAKAFLEHYASVSSRHPDAAPAEFITVKVGEESATLPTTHHLSRRQISKRNRAQRRFVQWMNRKKIKARVLYAPKKPKRFTLEELRAAIHRIPRGKAYGNDGIAGEALQMLPTEALRFLCDVLTGYLRRGEVPTSWKHSIIVPLHKAGKPPDEIKSYRPVSLTSVLSKVFERMLIVRMRPQIDALTDAQAGFRHDRSTADQLIRLAGEVRSHDRMQRAATTLFDFSQAFDRVDHRTVINLLIKRGVDPFTVQWISRWLSGRRAQVRLGRNLFPTSAPMTCGVPQGTVLGPVLYLFYTEELSQRLSALTSRPNPGVKIHHGFYADDLAVTVTTDIILNVPDNPHSKTDHKRKRDKLQQFSTLVTSTVTDWCKEHFFLVSPSKTYIIQWARTSQSPSLTEKDPLNIEITDAEGKKTTIAERNVERYLGLWFDFHLNWRDHVNIVKSSLHTTLKSLKRVSSATRGPTAHSLRTFHVALIRSKALYGVAAVSLDAAASTMERLGTTLATAAHNVAGLPRTADNNDAFLEAGMLPLKEEVALASLRYIVNHIHHPGTRESAALCLKSGIGGDLLKRIKNDNSLPRLPIGPSEPTPPPWHRLERLDQIQFHSAPPNGLKKPKKPTRKQRAALRAANAARLKLIREQAGRLRSRARCFTRWEQWTDGSVRQKSLKKEGGGAGVIYTSRRYRHRLTRRYKAKQEFDPLDLYRHEVKAAAGFLACSFGAEGTAMRASLEKLRSLVTGLQQRARTRRPGKRHRALLHHLLLVTDSQSLVRALETGPLRCTDPMIAEIWTLLLDLLDLCPDLHIDIAFLFSHAGTRRNERVDKLADKAVALPAATHAEVPIRPSDVLCAGRRIMKEDFLASLRTTDAGRRRREAKLPLKFSTKRERKAARPVQSCLARLRSAAHPDIGEYYHKLNPAAPTACRFCCPSYHVSLLPAKKVTLASALQPCPICNYTCTNRSNAVQHLTRKHSDEAPDRTAAHKLIFDWLDKHGSSKRRRNATPPSKHPDTPQLAQKKKKADLSRSLPKGHVRCTLCTQPGSKKQCGVILHPKTMLIHQQHRHPLQWTDSQQAKSENADTPSRLNCPHCEWFTKNDTQGGTKRSRHMNGKCFQQLKRVHDHRDCTDIFFCPCCDKLFLQKNSLSLHIDKVHADASGATKVKIDALRAALNLKSTTTATNAAEPPPDETDFPADPMNSNDPPSDEPPPNRDDLEEQPFHRESIRHVLLECSALQELRKNHKVPDKYPAALRSRKTAGFVNACHQLLVRKTLDTLTPNHAGAATPPPVGPRGREPGGDQSRHRAARNHATLAMAAMPPDREACHSCKKRRSELDGSAPTDETRGGPPGEAKGDSGDQPITKQVGKKARRANPTAREAVGAVKARRLAPKPSERPSTSRDLSSGERRVVGGRCSEPQLQKSRRKPCPAHPVKGKRQ